MGTWIFEPGHTSAEFRARHMMITWVRGFFKDIHGRLEFDWDSCLASTFEGEIDATRIWTGQPERDAHLRSADFFDVENHPKDHLLRALHGAGRRHRLQGPWQDEVAGGVVAGNEIDIVLDIEAINLGDLEQTGAIEYYR